jgi:hypothetical protein
VIAGRFGPDEFAGLAEATWTLTRLGRSLDAATATPARDYSDEHAPTIPRRGVEESGSGPRLPCPDPSERPHPDRGMRPSQHRDSGGSDTSARRFDLIITAAHPHGTQWLDEIDWTSMLTPRGLLAVVTYSDIRARRLFDPISVIVATERDHGLAWWDQVTLLTDPAAASPVSAANDTALAAAAAGSEMPVNQSPPVTRAHYDLLLFMAATPTNDDSSPDHRRNRERKTSDD